jgi:UDP-N-acetylmuramate: L-alanyl-gamma-D-glutamyl-meso-diaminopimelate ligase
MARFHFSGVGGAGMGNVACLLVDAGHDVKGSDGKLFPPMSEQLERSAVTCFSSYGESRLEQGFTPEIQVVANVLSSTHEEVLAGKALGLRQMSFPEVLEEYVLPNRKPYVVAGTHGKTTTSAILSHLLKGCGAGCFVGGVMKDGSAGCRLGREGAPFVLEGDEYDTAFFDKHSKFLHYAPQVLVLTHLEWDHVDIFPTFEHMLSEFKALLSLMPKDGKVVYCGDHPVLCDLVEGVSCSTISYGFNASNDVQIQGARVEGEWNKLMLSFQGDEICIETKFIGKIYHLNLVGAWCAAHFGEGIAHGELQHVLGSFAGARRRLEVLSGADPVLISDFAHHPTSVAETLSLVRENWPLGKLIAVFDPRNASSRRRTFELQLGEALALADEVHLAPPPLDSKLSEGEKLDVVALSSSIGAHAFGYEDGDEFVRSVVRAAQPGAVVLVMSCGACYGLLQCLWKHVSPS